MSFLSDSTVVVYLIRTLQIVCVLGAIILVHEFGHFIVAKKCGMTVDEFAVGIGPTLKSWERDGTLYRVGLFLFMGYVRIRGLEGGDPAPRDSRSQSDEPADAVELPDDSPQEAPLPPPAKDDPGSFYSRPIPHRIAALLAGAGMNIVFAAFLFCSLYGFWGVPVPPDTRVEEVTPGSAAATAGIEAGWKIAAVDGEVMEGPGDVQTAVAESEGRALRMTLARDGQTRDLMVTPRPKPEEEGEGWLIGVKFSDDSVSDVVERVDPGRAAAEAGIRSGDRIVAIEGEPVTDPASIRYALAAVPPDLETMEPEQVQLAPVHLTIERDGQRQDVTVHPEAKKRQRAKADDAEGAGSIEDYLVGDAGLALKIRYQQLGWGAALKYGFEDSWNILRDVFDSLKTLLRGQQLDQVGGPVMIVKALSEQAFYGWYALLSWGGMLSIMIGVFNLLPLPALDGGRVLFVLAEPISGGVLTRFGVDDAKEKIRRVEGLIHAVGLVALLLLMVLVSFRDVGRW